MNEAILSLITLEGRAYQTIVSYELTRILRIWKQSLLPSVITVFLYFSVFGFFLGTRIGQIMGFTYVEYIAPGLIMMTIINNSYSNVVFSFFSAKFQRSIEGLLSSPISHHTIILGYVTASVCRALLVGSLVFCIANLFIPLSFHDGWISFFVALSTSLLFALAGMINALFARNFDDTAVIPTFVLMPLIYLGGVFTPITLLPEKWQKIILLNPIFYIISAFRYGVLGIEEVSIRDAFSVILLLIIVLYAILHRLFKRGIALA